MCAVMDDTVLSAGIDIGTTTTSLIFSRLTIQEVGGFGDIPRFVVTDKEIFYRSPVYFTPLLSENEIDGKAVSAIIQREYEVAGISPKDIATGAVIITGETSRKQNAREVVRALSDFAGDFVVAAAGPNLESVLAGKGAGASALSTEKGVLVANMDIGGGTTNICFFEDGQVVDTACFDIGGRLIVIEDGLIVRMSPSVKKLAEHMDISLNTGENVREEECFRKLTAVCAEMTRILEQAVLLLPETPELLLMMTNQVITCGRVPEIITLSGGVADCVDKVDGDPFLYGDIGILLGAAISNSALLSEKMRMKTGAAHETMSATVIGAGNYSMEVSGSTIEYQNCSFPIKNIPVIYIEMKENNLDGLRDTIRTAIRKFCEETDFNGPFALASKGISCPSFSQIEEMALAIISAMERQIKEGRMLIVILESDIGKALGQALKRLLPAGYSFLCIDSISCGIGDYIDLGAPKASGKVIPVIVKTLIFQTYENKESSHKS